MKDCINNKNGFCVEFDDYLGDNFCETCDKNCPFYESKQFDVDDVEIAIDGHKIKKFEGEISYDNNDK